MKTGTLRVGGKMLPEPVMHAGNVASTVLHSVLHMASQPLDGNVQLVTAMATRMPLAGRG